MLKKRQGDRPLKRAPCMFSIVIIMFAILSTSYVRSEFPRYVGDNSVTTLTEPEISDSYSKGGAHNATSTGKDNNGSWNVATSPAIVGIQNQNVTESDFYRQSLNRDGYAPTDGPETPDVLWTSDLNDSVTTSPAVADGKVFVGTSTGKFCALDLKTGEVIWTFDAGAPISSSPAFQDGMVFFGTETHGRIYALDANTGLVKWLYEIPSGASVDSSPAVVDGKVIAGSSDGNLLCLDEEAGQVLWTADASGGYVSSPAIRNGTVFVACTSGVDAFDVQTGTLIWKFTTDWPVTSCPAVADGLVFAGAENNDHVYTLDQSDGQLVWNFWGGGWFTPPAVDSSKQLVIAGCKDFRLYCLDEYTGYVEWAYINSTNYLSAPTITANGLVYVGTSDGSLCCINETTGEEVWEYDATASIVSSPTIIDEHALVGTLEGKIYCFGPAFSAPIPGDVSGNVPGVPDGIVDMKDIAYLISLFNTKPSSPNWNPNADVNGDGVVNMRDVAIAVQNFNRRQ